MTTNGKIEVFGTIDAVPKDYQNSKFARGESALAIPAAETGVGAAPCGFFFVVRGHHARARPPSRWTSEGIARHGLGLRVRRR